MFPDLALDALPVDRFTWRGGEARALGVAAASGRFEWAEAPAGPALLAAVEEIRRDCAADWPGAYSSEVNTGLAAWLAAVADSVRRGVLLFVDYGLPRREYYAAERGSGTLLCHFRHRFNGDPFARPGLQDITAWVDFTALAEAADACDLEVLGYTSQAMFLLGCGLDQIIAGEMAGRPDGGLSLSAEARQLTLPGMMGERFQVMGLGRGLDPEATPLCGFSLQDLRYRL